MDDNTFNATLRMFENDVNLIEVLHGKPALFTSALYSGGFFTGAPQTRDHSELLGIRAMEKGNSTAALRLQFRATTGGYNLVIKNRGDHYDKLITNHWNDIFGVKEPSTDNPTVFILLNHQNRVIIRKDIATTHLPVSLMTNSNKHVGGIKVRGSPYLYLAETEEKFKIPFVLTLL